MANAPAPQDKAPKRFEAAQGIASQTDLDTATRAIKEVQTTNRLIIVVLFAAVIAIEIAIVTFAVSTLSSDTASRDDLKVQVEELNLRLQVLNNKLK